MTENSANANQETLSPLAKRIKAGIVQIARGNGLNPNDINIINEDNGIFSLHGTLTLTLEARREKKQVVGRPKTAHIYESVEALEEEIARACTELRHTPAAQQALEKSVFQGSGKGFGLADKIIPIPKLSFDFGLMAPCPACKGQGKGGCPVCHGQSKVQCPQCRGQREEWCGHCKGTGYQDGDYSKPRCTWCGEGNGRTRCLRCNGYGQIPCQTCNGTGHAHCRQCHGHGELAEITHLTFVWHAAFMQAAHETPRAVSHLMAKAPFDKLAALGHIAPSRVAGPLDEPPRLTDTDADAYVPPAMPCSLYYHLEVKIPWCEAVVKAGNLPAFQASAAGLKGRINNCPSFLDKLGDKTKRLHQEAMSHLLRLGMKNADKALAKFYPIGLSDKSRRDALREARDMISAKTHNIQIGAWVVGLLASVGISYVMNSVIGVGLGAVFGLALYHAIEIYGKMQFAKENGLRYKPQPKFGWEVAAIILVVAGVYALNLLT